MTGFRQGQRGYRAMTGLDSGRDRSDRVKKTEIDKGNTYIGRGRMCGEKILRLTGFR